MNQTEQDLNAVPNPSQEHIADRTKKPTNTFTTRSLAGATSVVVVYCLALALLATPTHAVVSPCKGSVLVWG